VKANIMSTERPSLIHWIIRAWFARPVLALLLALGGGAVGALWLSDVPRDVFPDLSAPVFNVIVQNAAMAPEELESSIAVPLEAAIAGVPQVKRVRSSVQLGVVQVTVEFEPEADYYRSRQLVAERVAQIASGLPPGTEPPLLSSLTGRLNEIFEFTLEAEPGVADLMTLRELADFEVRSRLLAVPGVSAVERLGGYKREFQVLLDPERMAARNVALDDVLHAVQGSNSNAAGGFIVRGPMEWTVRAVGRVTSLDDVRTTIVARIGGVPVLLGDVADVREGPAVRRGIAHRLRGEVVSCRVSKQFGADTTHVAAGIRAAIEEIRSGLPKGVELRTVYDQSDLVRSALGGVGRAVLVGAVLVVLVLLLLLGNLRAALLVTLTLPLSVALSGLLLKPLGIGINTLTLGGLAIAVGLLVDAGIIVTENVVHRMTDRRDTGDRKGSALEAALEVGRPVVFATLIVIAVFLPLFAMTGIEGRMYRPLAAAVVAAMAASLVLGVTLVPVVSGLFLRPRPEGKPDDVWLIRAVKRAYAPVLDACLNHGFWVRGAALVAIVPAVWLALARGADFMPKLDEGAFLLQTTLPPEASLDEVDRLNHRLEDVLREFPEVEDVVRRTGRAEQTEDPMPHTVSDVLVVLRPDRKRSLDALEKAMRERVEKVPALGVLFTTPIGMRIDEGLGGSPADLSVRIFGPDLDRLTELGERARAVMAGVEGLDDLRVEKLTGLPQIRVEMDRQALARVGLTPGDVVDAARIGLAGEEISEVWVGQRRFDLVVRLQDHRRDDVAAIQSLLISEHTGARVPLGQVARIEETFGPGVIRREAGSRRIAVEAGVTGRALSSAAREVTEKLHQELDLPAGYFVDVGGRVESQARAVRSLGVAVGLAVLAVFVLLYMALGRVSETLVILATLPDAFVGGIVALAIAGETWNVSSLVGLIGLFGIAVQNGLVLVTQTRALVARGLPFREALREASIGRVRPKLMTAATAILGLLPLLVLPLHGTEIERPLAIVMIGGLMTSTLFTLLALPSFYLLIERWRGRGAEGVLTPHPRPDG
jgi:cobalt-zinc-cadmium resistance protein CzcA